MRAGSLGMAVASLVSVAAPAPGQEHVHDEAHGVQSPPPVDSRFLTIEHVPEREELILSLGPIDLPAHTSHHALEQLPVQEGRFPFDMTIDAYRVEAIDGQGGRVPEALLGVPLEGGDRFLVLTMLHNPTDRGYEGVHVRMVMNYNRSRWTPLYRMYPFHIDVMFPLGSKAFDLPPGRSEKHWDGSPAIAGGIVGMGGHLHAYAEKLELIDLTEDRVLWRVEPDTGPDGHIEEVPVLRPIGRGVGFPIFPSHRYRVKVTYYNPTGDTIVDGGMGSVAGALIPYDSEAWPEAVPTDPTYAADYANVIVSTGAHGHEEADRPDPGDDR